MKQVFRTVQGNFVVAEVAAPALLQDGVLVRVERSLISPGTETTGGTMGGPPVSSLMGGIKAKAALARTGFASLATRGFVETWKATRGYLNVTGPVPRVNVGYSCAGTVVATSGGAGLPPKGARVACAGAGIANHAELVSVPRNLCALVPDGLSSDEAAYATLGAIALHGVRRAEAQAGEVAVVFGLGLVGLLVLQVAKAAGLRTIAIDLDPARVERARALGAWLAFTPPPREAAKDMVALVREATGGVGADRVLLCHASASSEPTNQGLRMCRRRGKVVVVGVFGLHVDREPFFKGEVDLVISTSYGPGRYDPLYEERGHDYPLSHVRWTEQRNLEEFLRLVATKAVDVRSLTDLTRPLDEAPEAYTAFTTAKPRPVGVLLAYPDNPTPSPRSGEGRGGDPKRVGLIGAGEFVRAVHLPILQRRGFHIGAVANRSAASSDEVARACGPDTVALADWRALLADPGIGLVIVGTRHDSHAEIAAAALDAGKHVFLEKPVATTREGLDLVKKAHARNPKLLLIVGHNRRFSPHAIALREQLAKRPEPPVLSYRVNAPFVPARSWLQDKVQGGGRIIGEGTHFLDLLAYLAGDFSPRLVEAFAAPPDGDKVVARDSCQVLLRYGNGAVATLAYSAQGAPGMAKERVEAHVPGQSFVLDDFRALEAEGPGATGVPRGETDKGFLRLWDEVEKALKGEPSLLPPAEHAFLATDTAFAIEERIRGLSRE